MIRSSVVLPQPDGPTKQTSSPALIARSTDCSATKPPNALWIPSRRNASRAAASDIKLASNFSGRCSFTTEDTESTAEG